MEALRLGKCMACVILGLLGRVNFAVFPCHSVVDAYSLRRFLHQTHTTQQQHRAELGVPGLEGSPKKSVSRGGLPAELAPPIRSCTWLKPGEAVGGCAVPTESPPKRSSAGGAGAVVGWSRPPNRSTAGGGGGDAGPPGVGTARPENMPSAAAVWGAGSMRSPAQDPSFKQHTACESPCYKASLVPGIRGVEHERGAGMTRRI